jgi:hypothetical protein
MVVCANLKGSLVLFVAHKVKVKEDDRILPQYKKTAFCGGGPDIDVKFISSTEPYLNLTPLCWSLIFPAEFQATDK